MLYHPGGLDTSGWDYSYLTTAVSLNNKERKYLTPAIEYNKLSCYLDYNKALYKLFYKLIKELNRYNSLPLIKLDN